MVTDTIHTEEKRKRKNYFFVIVKFTDGSMEISKELKDEKAINEFLGAKDVNTVESAEVILGHKKELKLERKIRWSL